jgi:hypothetical protein
MSDYTTTTIVKTEIGKTGSDHDAILALMITSASQAIDRWCKRPDGFVALSVAAARIYPGRGLPYILIDECTAITAVAVKDSVDDTTYTTWAATDWLAFAGGPDDPVYNRTPYTGLMVAAGGDYSIFLDGRQSTWVGFRPTEEKISYRYVPTVQVTAKWGYATTCPSAIQQACVIQVARWYKRGLSAFADTTVNADFGIQLYQKELDPDLAGILGRGGYVRHTV